MFKGDKTERGVPIQSRGPTTGDASHVFSCPRKDLSNVPDISISPSEAGFTATQVSVWETDMEEGGALPVLPVSTNGN